MPVSAADKHPSGRENSATPLHHKLPLRLPPKAGSHIAPTVAASAPVPTISDTAPDHRDLRNSLVSNVHGHLPSLPKPIMICNSRTDPDPLDCAQNYICITKARSVPHIRETTHRIDNEVVLLDPARKRNALVHSVVKKIDSRPGWRARLEAANAGCANDSGALPSTVRIAQTCRPATSSSAASVHSRHGDRLDCEARRRLAPLLPLPHRHVRSLDVAAEAIGVEQRVGVAVGGKLPLQRP